MWLPKLLIYQTLDSQSQELLSFPVLCVLLFVGRIWVSFDLSKLSRLTSLVLKF